MAARRPPVDGPYLILTAARGVAQGRSRPPLYPCPGRRLLLHLQRILDGIKGRELDIVELALHLLDLADVDVLNDVARLRIDRDRAARALPFHSFHGADQPIAIGRAAGLPQRFIED